MPIQTIYKPDFPVQYRMRHIQSMRMTTEQNFNSTVACTAHLPAVYEANNGYNISLRNILSGTLIKDPTAANLSTVPPHCRWEQINDVRFAPTGPVGKRFLVGHRPIVAA